MTDNLKQENERIKGMDFSDIPMDKQKRMIRIVKLFRDTPLLRQQTMYEGMKTIKAINPELEGFVEFETAMAMIQATVAHAIHFLIENDYLKYCEGDSK